MQEGVKAGIRGTPGFLIDGELVSGALPFSDFEKLALKDFGFGYQDKSGKDSFHIGPFNVELKRGEIIFLVGGNGSGKTTFMKLLTHLYHPSQGALYVDDVAIETGNIQSFRNMFSCIFTDFHLFDKLYGLQKLTQ